MGAQGVREAGVRGMRAAGLMRRWGWEASRGFLGSGASRWQRFGRHSSAGAPFEIVMNQVRRNAANAYALQYASGPDNLLLPAHGVHAPLCLFPGVGA